MLNTRITLGNLFLRVANLFLVPRWTKANGRYWHSRLPCPRCEDHPLCKAKHCTAGFVHIWCTTPECRYVVCSETATGLPERDSSAA